MREAVKQCLWSCRIASEQKKLLHKIMRSPNENSRFTQGTGWCGYDDLLLSSIPINNSHCKIKLKAFYCLVKFLSKRSQLNGLVQWFLTAEACLPWVACVNFQGDAIVKMFYNTFFINFDNQMSGNLTSARIELNNKIQQAFFNWFCSYKR